MARKDCEAYLGYVSNLWNASCAVSRLAASTGFPICRQANRELQKSQVDFLELAAGYLIRRARHRVGCARSLRESDDVADGLLACKQHDQAIKAKRNAAMRRSAKLERMDQVAELLFHLVIFHAKTTKDALLRSALWIRIEPPPISKPSMTMS